MIGGADIILEGTTGIDDADFIVRGLRSLWSNAFIQAATELRAVSIHAFKFPVVAPTELLVYRDAESYASWQADGATDGNQDTMVHVIVSNRSVTVVVDRHGSTLFDGVSELLEALRRNRIVLPLAA